MIDCSCADWNASASSASSTGSGASGRRSKRALAFVGDSQFQLIETLAHRLALLLLAEFPLAWVRVTLSKPGAIRHSRDVGVSIERRRADLAPRG